MKAILCQFNMFDINHKIYLFDTETGAKECLHFGVLAEIPQMISALCREHDTNKVMLYGSEDYTQVIKERIEDYAITMYDLTNIEVEILK